MEIDATPIDGLFHIKTVQRSDPRGSFARLWCEDTFKSAGINFTPLQSNISRNASRGTLRGMHFQTAPHGEAKLVQVVRGSIFDVGVDLRPGPNQGKWYGAELSAENGEMLYLPEGIAHGFVTLTDNADVLYLMGANYAPDHAEGVLWSDPAVGINWPIKPSLVSDKDQNLPNLADWLERGIAVT